MPVLSSRVQHLFGALISLGLFLVVGFMAYMYYPENHFAVQYQRKADCKRQQDIHSVADLVERYFKIQGRYPLATGNAISVVLTQETLPKRFKVNPPPEIKGKLVPTQALQQVLEKGLENAVSLPSDPQTAFAWGSRFYLYQLDAKGDYMLSATLFSAVEQSLELSEYQHSYRIGSRPSDQEKILSYNSITNQQSECDKP